MDIALVVSAVVHGQSLWLVALAASLCLAGAWASSRFFQRLADARGSLLYAWLFLTSLVTGVTIWCTHFVAMLGYRTGMATGFGWLLTATSLVIALLGSAAGLLIAARGPSHGHLRPAIGGTVLGLTVASVHYVGMRAMQMHGDVSRDAVRITISILLGVVLAAVAMLGARSQRPAAGNLMWGFVSASVLVVHFGGISALHVHDTRAMAGMAGMTGMAGMVTPASTEPRYVLAAVIAGMSFLTIGVGAVGYLIDQGRARSVERLQRIAMYDDLTGLPNRASLSLRLTREIERVHREGHRLALVVMDVDNFKEINDLYGHPAGDEVLRVLGSRMALLAQRDPAKFIARIGGDEFVALCSMPEASHLPDCLADLRRTLTVTVPVGADTTTPRTSVGAAIFPDDAATGDMLVNNADLAMYRAKGDPLLDTCVYDPEVDERTRLRRGLAADLRGAIARGELAVHYQVQTAVATGEAIGYEALLRWQHPQLGNVSPAEFIPLAEESGLIVPIGRWVLRQACLEAARWQPPLRVSVNVSAVQITGGGLARTVREVLQESGLPAHRLELEMTETAVFTDHERALRTVHAVKDLGVGLAIDDFGAGYSSLDVLRSFPFDRIKIDRSFFSGNGTPEQTVKLVETVLSLGRTFGMCVLAEGIETSEQLALLADVGCHEAQGYLFGRPTPLEDLVAAGLLTLSGPRQLAPLA